MRNGGVACRKTRNSSAHANMKNTLLLNHQAGGAMKYFYSFVGKGKNFNSESVTFYIKKLLEI